MPYRANRDFESVSIGEIVQSYSGHLKKVIEINPGHGFMTSDLVGLKISAYGFDGKYIPPLGAADQSRGRSHLDLIERKLSYEGDSVGINHYALFCRDSGRFCFNGQWLSAEEAKRLVGFISSQIDTIREC